MSIHEMHRLMQAGATKARTLPDDEETDRYVLLIMADQS
jgi:hypothetical protein